MWWTWHSIYPSSEKVGVRPRVPHLIAPMGTRFANIRINLIANLGMLAVLPIF